MSDSTAARDPFIAAERAEAAPSRINEKSNPAIEFAAVTENHLDPAASPVVQTAAEMIETEQEIIYAGVNSTPKPSGHGSPITFAPARPRVGLNGETIPTAHQPIGPPPTAIVGTDDIRKMAIDHVDEYLVDGGDRGYPIHYEGATVAGVESEDTFAEFKQLDGSRHVTPSNTVAVYAPRFGTLRTVTGTETGAIVERASTTRDFVGDSGIHNRVAAGEQRQADEPSGLRMRSRASGMLSRNQGADLAHSMRATQHDLLQNVFEDSLFISSGRLEQGNQAWLAKSMQAAEVWTQDQRALLIVNDDSVHEVYHAERVAEMSALDDNGSPGRMRLLKLADKRTAHIGEEVTFSLRYDNLGDKPVGDVRIIDHLTPRLEIIEGSVMWGAADAPLGRWEIADHEDGGTVLIFVLNEPLEGKSGGVITFTCRVR